MTDYHGPISGQLFEAGVTILGVLVLYAIPTWIIIQVNKRIKNKMFKTLNTLVYIILLVWSMYSCIMLNRDL